MGSPIESISLKGFRSIRSLEKFELKGINVLIGANGCGKSNFVSFFSLLREIVEQRMAVAINKAGGADTQLYLGPKVTDTIEASLDFGHNGYLFSLVPTSDNRLIFTDERIKYDGAYSYAVNRSIGSGQSESELKAQLEPGNRNRNISTYIYNSISSWTVYHVHDTSETSALRRFCSIRDNEQLRPNGSNLAAFLLKLREENNEAYVLIVEAVRLVAPFFSDFRLQPKKQGQDEVVQLEWLQRSCDYPFHPSQLSDGTIRFIALATALLQPSPPTTILIDEPELGLHPFALSMLGNLVLQAESKTQLIISTQSAPLLDVFSPEHIVVVERKEGGTTFERLRDESLSGWLKDYSLGELWQKNVYGGGPRHE